MKTAYIKYLLALLLFVSNIVRHNNSNKPDVLI